ncbi:MAG: hypothetical protein KDA89_13085, partial [Planctomycetaceae bacterium]|nr:hypothetical protein [Planctomycetaceae bacterium]
DTEDDVVYSVNAAYSTETHSTQLLITSPTTVLPVGDYRLVVRAQITDLGGNVLNGGSNQEFYFSTPLFSSEFSIRDSAVSPTAGLAEDGHALVAWDESGYIFGQFLGTDGKPIHSDLFVDISAATWDHNPEIDMLPDGRFVVAYDAYYGGGDWDAAMAIFDSGGSLIRDVGYAPGTIDRETDAAISPDGKSVLVWSTRDFGTSSDILGHVYDSAGNLLVSLSQVNQTSAGTQSNPQVAFDGAGNFIVVWQSQDQDGSGYGIFARRYDSDGAPLGNEFQVNTVAAGDQSAPVVDAADNGEFTVAWQGTGSDGRTHVYVRQFDSMGSPAAIEFSASVLTQYDQTQPSVAVDATGDVIVAWQTKGLDDPVYSGVFAARFDSEGRRIGAEFLVNNTVTAGQQADPHVTANSAGRLLAVWQSETSVHGRFLEMGLNDVADLIVESVSAPDLYVAGQPLTVSATITNAGAATSSAFYGRYYLSRDQRITKDDEPLTDTIFVSGLLPLESYTDGRSVSVRAGLTGSYYVGFIADVDNEVVEFDESTLNQLSAPSATVFTTEPPPDLQIQSVDAPATAESGKPITVTWTTINAGSGPVRTGVWSDRAWLSADLVLDSTDRMLGSFQNTTPLAAGQSYLGTTTGTVPNGFEGNYYVIVETDYLDQADELSYENNNTGLDAGAVAVSLSPPPDLQVSDVDAPPSATAGQQMQLSWTVANAGSGDAPASAWLDRVFLSADTVLDLTSDIAVAGFQHEGGLASGTSYTSTQQITVPETYSGNWYVLVQTDATDNVYEHTAEDNNATADSGQTSITESPPDLVVTTVNAPDSGIAGHALTVSWTVRNSGTGAPSAVVWSDQVFLSADQTLDSASDFLLRTVQHSGPLAVGESYSVSASVVLPLSLSGGYYIFIRTDGLSQVYEGAAGGESNNLGLDTTPVAVSIAAVTAPATEGFEVDTTAELSPAWTFVDNDGSDLIAVSSIGNPHGGTRQLIMQAGTSAYQTQSAVWAVDLNGQTGATLDFWVRQIDSPTGIESASGTNYIIIIYIPIGGGGGGRRTAMGAVEISQDGTTWKKLSSISANTTAQHYSIDLDQAVSDFGLNAANPLYVRLTHSGTKSQGAFAWDDIRV